MGFFQRDRENQNLIRKCMKTNTKTSKKTQKHLKILDQKPSSHSRPGMQSLRETVHTVLVDEAAQAVDACAGEVDPPGFEVFFRGWSEKAFY